MDGEWKDEREYTERRGENDPADEDKHRVAQSAEEECEGLTRCLGGARNCQGEKQREKNQRHHRPACGGGDRVRREERDKPRRECLRLSFRRDFIRRFDRARWKLQCAVRRKEPERSEERRVGKECRS